MTPLFKKLNLKEQQIIFSINHPVSFETELKAIGKLVQIKTQVKTTDKTDFIIFFCTKQAEVDKATAVVAKTLQGDGIVWFAYPKGTSKKYKCDFNRDTGWEVLGENGFEPVRQVAIDEDWSALRFRRVEHIKTMTRSFAMTKEGKAKVAKKK